MAKSYLQLATDFTTLSNDASTSNLTLGKSLINIGIRKVLGLSDWTFMKDSKSISSGTSVQDYDPPYNMYKLEYVNVWYGNVWYVPKEVKDGESWRKLNAVTVYSSIPQYYYISNRTHKISLFPIPNDSNGTIKMGFTKKIRDYSVTDYSTGSVTVSSAGTIFTGNNTTWHAGMVGRYLQVTDTNTAIDDYWFEITNFSSATTVSVKEVSPNAVSGGTYTISELVPLPDGFESLPLWYSLFHYYQMKEKPTLAREYERFYNDGVLDLLARDSRSVTGLIEKQAPITMYDVNANPWTMGTIQ